MKRLLRLAALASLCAALGANAQEARPPAHERAEALRARLLADCPAALEDARAFFRARSSSWLALAAREPFDSVLAECALSEGDTRLALYAGRRAGARGEETASIAAVAVAVDADRFVDARMALAALQANAEAGVGKLSESVLWRLRWGIWRTRNEDELLAFHEAALAAGFAPRQFADAAYMRVEHARLLLARSDVARARERIAGPLTAYTAIAIRSDKRFDALRGDTAFERLLDPLAAAENHVALARAAAEREPRSLATLNELLSALQIAGRPADVVSEARRALALDAASEGGHWEERDGYLSYVLNRLGLALYDLGEVAEADAAYERAIEHAEETEDDDPRIGYALKLVDAGEPRRALRLIAAIDEAPVFREVWLAAIRVCAAEQLGDSKLRSEALAYLVAHESENRAARLRALLCAEELSLAADLMKRRLADSFEREDALAALQLYEEPLRPALPRYELVLARLRELRERHDVQLEVRAVGRSERIPLSADGFNGI